MKFFLVDKLCLIMETLFCYFTAGNYISLMKAYACLMMDWIHVCIEMGQYYSIVGLVVGNMEILRTLFYVLHNTVNSTYCSDQIALNRLGLEIMFVFLSIIIDC